MEFGLLGPLEVRRNGEAVAIGAAKQRALLAMLLLHANEVVSTDRLIDALWGEHPPARAGKALQVYVSQLRKLLDEPAGGSPLVTRAPGYLLQLGADALDVFRFEGLAEQGRAALARGEHDVAVANLGEALALWRGPALADLAFEPFAQSPSARLEEQRLAAIEDRVEADLALGRHAQLAGELEELVAAHPLRERLRGQLMLALYRAGRQADALAAFQEARRALVDELGIEPGRELRAVHQAILQQDPDLDLALSPARPPPPQVEPEPRRAAAAAAPGRDAPARQARKTVTALFVRLTASSPAGDVLDPEAAQRVTGRALAAVRDAVGRHGGSLETVAEEAITAVFGLPAVHEDDALRAVRAAAELHAPLSDLVAHLAGEGGASLEYRLGVSTGQVVTGGDEASRLPATGAPLVVSARLAHSAEAGDILLDDATHRLVRDAVGVEPVSAGSIACLRLVEVPGAPQRRARRLGSPMIGRIRERRRLGDAFEQAVTDGSCQLFTILGHAGVGKSRLVQEFIDGIASEAVVAQGRCLPYGEGITYWPLREVLKDALSLGEADSPEWSREQLAAALAGAADAALVAEQVAALVGLAEADTAVEEGFRSVQAVFEALARQRPLVLVFDDIHWGEATFLDLVEHVAEWTRDAPLLLICVARPELLDLRPGWGGGKLNATTVLLEPLSADESTQLVDSLAGSGVDADTRERVVSAAEGNPLFVEEMLALALEDGGSGALTTPPTIQALLSARLDRLSEDERSVLEPAAVEGKVFHEGCVTELVPEPLRTSAAAGLAALMRKELIRPDRPLFAGEHAFRFRHLLIRDAAYEAIPKQERAALHERYAGWLERRAGDHMAEYDEIVGYHLEQAFAYHSDLGPVDAAARELARRAAERLGAAGRRAFVRSDANAGVKLVSRAAALLPPDDPARIELVPNVRVAQGMGGDLAWAEAILSDALGADDARLRAHASVQRGFVQLFGKPDTTPEELVAIAEEAIRPFRAAGDDLGLARAWRLIAQARYLARRAGECVEASELALTHARRAGDQFEIKEIVEWLIVALALGPTPAAEASRRCAELLEVIAGERFLEVTLPAVRAYLEAIQGRRAVADELLASARRKGGDARYLRRVAYFGVYAGLMLAGDPAAAERELRAGADALREVGELTNYCSVTSQLALALCDQGRYDEAEHYTRESEAAARANDVMANVLWRAGRAKVLAARGELASAEALADEAIAFADPSDFVVIHALACQAQAEVLQRAGRHTEARAAVDRAVALFEQKGDVVSAARAASALGQ